MKVIRADGNIEDREVTPIFEFEGAHEDIVVGRFQPDDFQNMPEFAITGWADFELVSTYGTQEQLQLFTLDGNEDLDGYWLEIENPNGYLIRQLKNKDI